MTGYHANDKKRCEEFVKDPDYLIVDDGDTDYLGSGMYFWNHLADARYWQEKYNKDTIVNADIDLSAMLDLTDPDVLKHLDNIMVLMKRSLDLKKAYDIHLGKRMNYLFQSCSCFLDKYNCLKGRRNYDKEESNFLRGTKLSAKSVDIFCVRKSSVATERNFVEL